MVSSWTSSGVMTGGITYNNGYITVPMTGVYYIYAQLWYAPLEGQRYCGFQIHHNRSAIGRAFQDKASSIGEHETQYIGTMKAMSKGDRLSVRVTHTCRYLLNSPRAEFGCFCL